MNLEIKGNKNYAATVVAIDKTVPHPNADNLECAIIVGNSVAVQKGIEKGTVGLFFPIESKISAEFLKANNLFRDPLLNKDQTKKGFFESHGRVKAVKIRGQKSEGFFIEITSLIPLLGKGDVEDFKVGDEFDHIDGNKLCEKYMIVVKNDPSMGGGRKKGTKAVPRESRLVEGQFKLHIDTEQLKKNMWRINPEDIVSLTSKWHGCVEFNTIVETENGPMKIGDVVEGKIDTKILARDVVSCQDVFVPIDDFYKKENDGEWLEIELEDGRTIQITTNNPVWLPLINAYREAGELKVGDTLLVN